MVGDIKNAYEGILKNVTWMDETTRAAALKKLSAMHEYIAYPDFLLLDIPRLDRYYEKVKHLEILFKNFEYEKKLKFWIWKKIKIFFGKIQF